MLLVLGSGNEECGNGIRYVQDLGRVKEYETRSEGKMDGRHVWKR